MRNGAKKLKSIKSKLYVLIDYQDQAAFLIRGASDADEVREIYAAHNGLEPEEFEPMTLSILPITEKEFNADGLVEIVSW